MVVRTHLLTHVAPIQPLPGRFAELLRNLLAQLDREIRDAPARIEPSRRRDRPRRTRLETPRASPAAVRLERRVCLELEIEHERAEKEERAALRIHEHRVLPEPAEPRAPREFALEQRTGVDVRLAGHRAPGVALEPPVQLAQPALHHVVIVVAARVPGDRA